MKLSMKAGLLAAVVMGMVSGCGGGGGGTVATPVVVSGTAATGAAIAAGSITLKCVSGTSTAVTTGTDGSFSIDVSAVTLPCVGRVDYKDAAGAAQKLHTFVSAAGVANITPVTDLLVASLTGGAAADAFDKFDSTKAKGYTAALVKAAAAVVKAYLKNTLGVDTTNLPDDPVGTKLVAKSGSVTGDAFDKVLDDFKAKLATAGKTLVGAASELGGGGTLVGVTGCTGAVATLFDTTKGSYTATAVTFDNSPGAAPGSMPASVAGIANGATVTVQVNATCSVVVGPAKFFAYKDNSYATFPGAGGTQYDVDLLGATGPLGGSNPHFEVFIGGKRGLSFFENTNTAQGVRLDEL